MGMVSHAETTLSRPLPGSRVGFRLRAREAHVALLPLLYATVVLLLFPRWTVDDAYISLRYAENLAHHGQLVWNLGRDPVEGYTGILWPLLLAALLKLGLPALSMAKGLSAACFISGGCLVMRISEVLDTGPSIRKTLLALYFGAPFMYPHVFSGLETLLFTFLLLFAAWRLLICLASPCNTARSECLLFVSLLLAGLCRPEGAIFGLLSLIAVLIQRRTQQGSLSSLLRRSVAIYIGPAALYFLWRWRYYGHLLPNTFYAKEYHGFVNPESVVATLRFLVFLTIPLAASLALRLRTRGAQSPGPDRPIPGEAGTRRLFLGTCGTYVFLVLLQYLHTALVMNYAHRFFVPLFPLILFLWAASLPHHQDPKVLGGLLATLGVLALLQGALYAGGLARQVQAVRYYGALLSTEHRPAGELLKRLLPPTERIAVQSDAGMIPYVSDLSTIDFGGLNDEVLARHPSPEAVADYFFACSPAAVVFTSYRPDRVEHGPDAAAILSDPRFKPYALVRRFGAEDGRYFQFVYVRLTTDVVAEATDDSDIRVAPRLGSLTPRRVLTREGPAGALPPRHGGALVVSPGCCVRDFGRSWVECTNRRQSPGSTSPP